MDSNRRFLSTQFDLSPRKGRPATAEKLLDAHGDREFESGFLRQPVCLTSEPPGNVRRAPRFGRGLPGEWDVRDGRPVTTGLVLAVFL
jgi:hypothetical protein